MSDNTGTVVHFDCQYYSAGMPVTVEDGKYFHALTRAIDIDFHADVYEQNLGDIKDANIMLVRSHARDEWQFVAVHATQANGRANKRNRVLATIPKGDGIDRLLREHVSDHSGAEYTLAHRPRWGVRSFDPATGNVSIWLADAERTGLPYATLRAAGTLIEEGGATER